MNNPGVYDLGDYTVTTAVTAQVITEGVSSQGVSQALIDRLEGMLAASIFCEMTNGVAGTSITVVVQTSLNHNDDWLDIARFDFANTPAIKVANLSGLLSKAITSYSALSADSVMDGVLGDRLRAKITSVGTYTTNTGVSIRAVVR